MSGAILEFCNVVKCFGSNAVVNDVSFSVSNGEFFTLLGPSGCGKTTTLRLLAGLEMLDGGSITLDGRCIAAPGRGIWIPPDKRNVGMMFQSYAIWPHLTVFENVAFPLRVRREPAQEIRKRVGEAIELVGLGGLEERGATLLSGGQQQRVALARAIVYTPTLLLLDEPLSNLDVKLREQMRVELRALQQRLGLTVIYVTHDQAEAMAMSDRIAMFNKGRLEQVGTPKEVYEQPATRFVGDFLGRTILIRGTVRRTDGRCWVEVQNSEGRVAVPPDAVSRFADGEQVRLLSRPEEVVLLPVDKVGPNQVIGRIESVSYMGDHLEYTIAAAGRSLTMPASKKEPHAVGAEVRLAFNPDSVTVVQP